MRKNCSSDQGKLLKFEAEGQEFVKILNSERYEQVLVTKCFFNLFLEDSHSLISNKLEQLEFKLENIIGI